MIHLIMLLIFIIVFNCFSPPHVAYLSREKTHHMVENVLVILLTKYTKIML